MRKIQMVVFDVDGTLYDIVNSEIPSSAKLALQKLRENGIKIVIATGRTHYALGKTINDLKPDYVISCSGGTISDKDGQIIETVHYSLDDTLKVIEFTNKYDAGLMFKFDDKMIIYKHINKIPWIINHMTSDVGMEPFNVDITQTRHLESLPLACCIHADEKLVREELEPSTNLNFIRYTKDEFDVVNRGIDKSTGLKMLLKHLNMNAQDVMCFGDNRNDLEMLEAVEYSVAMGNAIDEIKEAAYYITDTSDNNGIYNALKHFELI